MKNWGGWPDEMHYEFDQISRIAGAQSSEMDKEVIEVNKEEQVITVKGSGKDPYVATLEDCTCQDFIIRGRKTRPCKHIYRLALELGVLELPEPSEHMFDPKEEIPKLEQMYREGKISAQNCSEMWKALKKMK